MRLDYTEQRLEIAGRVTYRAGHRATHFLVNNGTVIVFVVITERNRLLSVHCDYSKYTGKLLLILISDVM